MAHRPPIPGHPIAVSATSLPPPLLPPPPPAASSPPTATAAESRTLLTFPTEGLPSPRLLPQSTLRAFPVRHPSGSAPAQTQTNRWLCCRCAEEGYRDPVGMVHYPAPFSPGSSSPPPPPPSSSSAFSSCPPSTAASTPSSVSQPPPSSLDHHHHHYHHQPPLHTHPNTNTNYTTHDPAPSSDLGGSSSSSSYNTCWRLQCLHRKCVNCALYAGPMGRAKLLIRTVGGLYTSPRFVDPVYWECGGCGEWERNRFDSRSTLGATGCRGEGCGFAWRAAVGAGGGAGGGRGQVGGVGGQGMGRGMGMGGVPGGGGMGVAPGAGVLVAESVVMNRYGERLGTADQRIAVADGPWEWQRRALGDPRCAVVPGLRGMMKRTGEGGPFQSSVPDSRRMCDLRRLWRDGEPVPHYPYRRPPPVDEDDVGESNEYEGSYLAAVPTEALDKGKGVDHQHNAMGQSRNPRFCPTPGSVVTSPVGGGPNPPAPPSGFFQGWNHLQM